MADWPWMMRSTMFNAWARAVGKEKPLLMKQMLQSGQALERHGVEDVNMLHQLRAVEGLAVVEEGGEVGDARAAAELAKEIE